MGWFDSIYSDAEGDYKAVFWADLQPNPYLVEWLQNNPLNKQTKSAIVIGCGVGDDAEIIAKYEYDVVAFDIAPSAIELCKSRYPDTKVSYLSTDLFDCLKNCFEDFDLVYECNTIQVLLGEYRKKALLSIVSLMAKSGDMLVSYRSEKSGEQEDDIPLPLDREEIDSFIYAGLREQSFLEYDDNQIPSVPHLFSTYKK